MIGPTLNRGFVKEKNVLPLSRCPVESPRSVARRRTVRSETSKESPPEMALATSSSLLGDWTVVRGISSISAISAMFIPLW
ncbi:hypothetical protein BLNAU_2229 [Blattamonas nauphoetae]|uniref:Uncharacterized protein n=1 Tax=Blattamonas nauphoetae TaxID=2049346 RepID=A0ABQ9YGT3_9EUKA|nr:hypothetical protein BLNAU_2229 [Blattamonas nauphoetae]